MRAGFDHQESAQRPDHQAAFRLAQPGLSPAAKRLGAINTLTLEPAAGAGDRGPVPSAHASGRPKQPPILRGASTDAPAALTWLQRGLGLNLDELARVRFGLLGTGGLARSLAAALTGIGAHVTVCGRKALSAAALAKGDSGTRNAIGPSFASTRRFGPSMYSIAMKYIPSASPSSKICTTFG